MHTYPTSQLLPALLGSSELRAVGDDARKDEDNVGWVHRFDAAVRAEWVRRVRWVRYADRLAENERFDPGARRFARFVDGWRRVEAGLAIDERDACAQLLADVREAVAQHPELAAIWDEYLDALGAYHAPELPLRTLDDHRRMLDRLSGRIFQLVPFLTPPQRDAIAGLGMLDQFVNNLRDLAEDGALGITYFPDDVLARTGVARADLCCAEPHRAPGFHRLMRFWLDEYLPQLRAGADRFVAMTDLHPSVAVMRDESLARYQRIVGMFRAVGHDCTRFAAAYWATPAAG